MGSRRGRRGARTGVGQRSNRGERVPKGCDRVDGVVDRAGQGVGGGCQRVRGQVGVGADGTKLGEVVPSAYLVRCNYVCPAYGDCWEPSFASVPPVGPVGVAVCDACGATLLGCGAAGPGVVSGCVGRVGRRRKRRRRRSVAAMKRRSLRRGGRRGRVVVAAAGGGVESALASFLGDDERSQLGLSEGSLSVMVCHSKAPAWDILSFYPEQCLGKAGFSWDMVCSTVRGVERAVPSLLVLASHVERFVALGSPFVVDGPIFVPPVAGEVDPVLAGIVFLGHVRAIASSMSEYGGMGFLKLMSSVY